MTINKTANVIISLKSRSYSEQIIIFIIKGGERSMNEPKKHV